MTTKIFYTPIKEREERFRYYSRKGLKHTFETNFIRVCVFKIDNICHSDIINLYHKFKGDYK